MLLLVGGMLWSAAGHLAQPQTIPPVHSAALWMALVALAVRRAVSLCWRPRAEFVAAYRQCGMPALTPHPPGGGPELSVIWPGSPFDPLAALAVGLLIARMGYRFAVSALHDLMDRAVDEEMQQAIADTLRTTPGVAGLHDLKTRKAGIWCWWMSISRWLARCR